MLLASQRTACFGDPDGQAFDFRVVHQDVGLAVRARQVVQCGLGKIDFPGHKGGSFPK